VASHNIGASVNVLHVMKWFPYPPNNGFCSDIWERMLSMRRLGCTIDLVVIAPREEIEAEALAKVQSVVRRLIIVSRRHWLKSAFRWTPTLVARNGNLAHLSLDDDYDLVLAESEHMMPIFDNPSLKVRRRVLRVHNDEAKYMWEIAGADNRPPWKAFFVAEAVRFLRFTRKAHKKVDEIWFISQREFDRFSGECRANQTTPFWLPASLGPEEAETARVVIPGMVLFVGSLGQPLNREGLRWYLREVHGQLADDTQYHLVIAGNTGGTLAANRFAREIRSQYKCKVILDAESLKDLYQTAQVIINPMRRGSGVKIKTIHALKAGIPLVTTTVGAEGSGFKDEDHLRVADSPNAFAVAIREILDNPQRAAARSERAIHHLRLMYDSDTNLRRIMANLQRGMNGIDAIEYLSVK